MKKLTVMFKTSDNKTAYKTINFKPTVTGETAALNLLTKTHLAMQYKSHQTIEIEGKEM